MNRLRDNLKGTVAGLCLLTLLFGAFLVIDVLLPGTDQVSTPTCVGVGK